MAKKPDEHRQGGTPGSIPQSTDTKSKRHEGVFNNFLQYAGRSQVGHRLLLIEALEGFFVLFFRGRVRMPHVAICAF
jgi:hypothetical protein